MPIHTPDLVLPTDNLPVPIWEQTDTVMVDGQARQVRIADYGPIGQIVEGNTDPNVWTGDISFAKRCETNPKLYEAFRAAAASLNERYVAIDPNAGPRCMDERPTEESFEPSFSFAPDRTLGPQAIGATPVLATAYHVVNMGDQQHIGGTNGEDVREISSILKEASAHTDEVNRPNLEINLLAALRQIENANLTDEQTIKQAQSIANMLNIGCIAVDDQLPILGKMIDVPAHAQMNGLQRLLLGERFSQSIADELNGRLLRLLSRSDCYFERDPKSGLHLFKRRAVEVIEEVSNAAKPIACYMGKHNGVALAVNQVPGQTLDSTRVSHDTDHEVQIWGQDATFSRASLLFPMPKRASEKTRKRIENKHHGYNSLRTAFLIGAMMRSNDGSAHLLIRSLVE